MNLLFVNLDIAQSMCISINFWVLQDKYEYTYIPNDDSGIDVCNGDLHTPTEEDIGDLSDLILVNNKTSTNMSRSKRVCPVFSSPVSL